MDGSLPASGHPAVLAQPPDAHLIAHAAASPSLCGMVRLASLSRAKADWEDDRCGEWNVRPNLRLQAPSRACTAFPASGLCASPPNPHTGGRGIASSGLRTPAERLLPLTCGLHPGSSPAWPSISPCRDRLAALVARPGADGHVRVLNVAATLPPSLRLRWGEVNFICLSDRFILSRLARCLPLPFLHSTKMTLTMCCAVHGT